MCVSLQVKQITIQFTIGLHEGKPAVNLSCYAQYTSCCTMCTRWLFNQINCLSVMRKDVQSPCINRGWSTRWSTEGRPRTRRATLRWGSPPFGHDSKRCSFWKSLLLLHGHHHAPSKFYKVNLLVAWVWWSAPKTFPISPKVDLIPQNSICFLVNCFYSWMQRIQIFLNTRFCWW